MYQSARYVNGVYLIFHHVVNVNVLFIQNVDLEFRKKIQLLLFVKHVVRGKKTHQ